MTHAEEKAEKVAGLSLVALTLLPQVQAPEGRTVAVNTLALLNPGLTRGQIRAALTEIRQAGL